MEYVFRGDSVTLIERRPRFRGMPGENWTRMRIAQVRFDPNAATWGLFWADRNERWHRYEDVGPTASLGPLLEEIDQDSIGVFWG